MRYGPHQVIDGPELVGRVTLVHNTKGIKGYFPLSWWPSVTVGTKWYDWTVVEVEQPARERLKKLVEFYKKGTDS